MTRTWLQRFLRHWFYVRQIVEDAPSAQPPPSQQRADEREPFYGAQPEKTVVPSRRRACFCGRRILTDGVMLSQDRRWVHGHNWCGDPVAAAIEANLGIALIAK